MNVKVLVTGGYKGFILNDAELYDLSTGTWATTSSMYDARVYHVACVLRNGKVLVTGGYGDIVALNSTELYQP
jgi:hypothetical protein